MTTNRLAIDLSGEMIRVVAGSPGGAMRATEAMAPAGSISSGGVINSSAVGALLKELVSRVEGKDSRTMVVASDTLASFRVLSFARDTTEPKIDALVRAQLPVDGNRMGMQRHEVTANGSDRTVYAVAFDRLKVQALAAAVRLAGLEPSVVELKSLCIARIAPAPACVVLDLTVEPAEIFLVDRSLPRLWHTQKADSDAAEVGHQLASGVKSVLGFYRRIPGGDAFAAEAPVFMASVGPLPAPVVDAMQAKIGRPIYALPVPSRVPPEIRHAAYLACLGLLMRRR